MKKRFKLFATIASLAIAVAVMAYGVYAATQATYTINGTVTYTSVHVKATVAHQVYGTTAEVKVVQTADKAKLLDTDKWAEVGTGQSYDFTDTTIGNTKPENFDATAVEYKLAEHYVYKIVFTITNDSPFAIQAVITPPTPTAGANWWVLAEGVTSIDAKGETTPTGTATFYLGLTDAAVSIADEVDANIVLTLQDATK